jgi:hypothetical protein
MPPSQLCPKAQTSTHDPQFVQSGCELMVMTADSKRTKCGIEGTSGWAGHMGFPLRSCGLRFQQFQQVHFSPAQHFADVVDKQDPGPADGQEALQSMKGAGIRTKLQSMLWERMRK